MNDLTRTFTWIPISERLPKESGDYLTITYTGHLQELHYAAKKKAFNTYDDIDRCDPYIIEVNYWTPAEDLYVKEEMEDIDG